MNNTTFRAKRISTQEWVYGDYYYCMTDNAHKVVVTKTSQSDAKNPEPPTDYQEEIFIDPKTLGQSLSFPSSDNIPIYKGDIVHCYTDESDGMIDGIPNMFVSAEQTGVVHYKNTCWCVSGNNLALTCAETVLIIGNVWDNPDLIPEDEKYLFKSPSKKKGLLSQLIDEVKKSNPKTYPPNP